MAKSFDYSKWDNIELSDDESDLHPNIDKESWFRLKHRTRLEREEKEDHEVREFQEKNNHDEARVKLIQAQLRGVASGESEDAEYIDTEALEVELQELQAAINGRKKRIEEIQEKRKWNIDNICKVKEDKTIVNTATIKPLKDMEMVTPETSPTAAALAASSSPTDSAAAITASKPSSTVSIGPVDKTVKAAAPASAPASSPLPKGAEPAQTYKREKMAVITYNDYAIKHEKILEQYSEIQDLEATRDFLFKHCDILLHEHAQSYMLLSCLEDEMNGKHKRMKLVCRQSQILTHIHELGTSMHRDPRDVILPFFKRISEAEYLTGFLNAVEDFIAKIQKRAVEKRKEMDAVHAAEEEEVDYEATREGALGPGGLDPIQVLKSLPIAMRKAFESQDVTKLQEVLSSMDAKEARFYMRQCVDAGLWVAKDRSVFEDRDDEDEEGEGQEGEGGGEALQSEEVDN